MNLRRLFNILKAYYIINKKEKKRYKLLEALSHIKIENKAPYYRMSKHKYISYEYDDDELIKVVHNCIFFGIFLGLENSNDKDFDLKYYNVITQYFYNKYKK